MSEASCEYTVENTKDGYIVRDKSYGGIKDTIKFPVDLRKGMMRDAFNLYIALNDHVNGSLRYLKLGDIDEKAFTSPSTPADAVLQRIAKVAVVQRWISLDGCIEVMRRKYEEGDWVKYDEIQLSRYCELVLGPYYEEKAKYEFGKEETEESHTFRMPWPDCSSDPHEINDLRNDAAHCRLDPTDLWNAMKKILPAWQEHAACIAKDLEAKKLLFCGDADPCERRDSFYPEEGNTDAEIWGKPETVVNTSNGYLAINLETGISEVLSFPSTFREVAELFCKTNNSARQQISEIKAYLDRAGLTEDLFCAKQALADDVQQMAKDAIMFLTIRLDETLSSVECYDLFWYCHAKAMRQFGDRTRYHLGYDSRSRGERGERGTARYRRNFVAHHYGVPTRGGFSGTTLYSDIKCHEMWAEFLDYFVECVELIIPHLEYMDAAQVPLPEQKCPGDCTELLGDYTESLWATKTCTCTTDQWWEWENGRHVSRYQGEDAWDRNNSGWDRADSFHVVDDDRIQPKFM